MGKLSIHTKIKKLWFSSFIHSIIISHCDFCDEELKGNDFNRLCKRCVAKLNSLHKIHINSTNCIQCDQLLKANPITYKSKSLSKRKSQLSSNLCKDCNNSESNLISNRSLFLGYELVSTNTQIKTNNLAQRLVYDFKFKQHPSYGKIIHYFTIKNLYNHLKEFDVFIPIPLSSAGIRKRGFCVVTLVTKLLAKTFNRPWCQAIVRNEKNYQTAQHFLNREERQSLITGKYVYQEQFKHFFNHKKTKILLIDDIYTTGTTLQYAAKLIKNHHPHTTIGSFTFLRARNNK